MGPTQGPAVNVVLNVSFRVKNLHQLHQPTVTTNTNKTAKWKKKMQMQFPKWSGFYLIFIIWIFPKRNYCKHN